MELATKFNDSIITSASLKNWVEVIGASLNLLEKEKFICHFISGVVFFASYAPEGMSPIIYSLTINASMIIPECIICCALIKFLPTERLLNLIKNEELFLK